MSRDCPDTPMILTSGARTTPCVTRRRYQPGWTPSQRRPGRRPGSRADPPALGGTRVQRWGLSLWKSSGGRSAMRVLVAYGSKSGGTEGLARSIGEGLAAAGHEVAVRPAGDIDGLGGWDAVVVGGAIYGWRWYRPARRFVRRNQ